MWTAHRDGKSETANGKEAPKKRSANRRHRTRAFERAQPMLIGRSGTMSNAGRLPVRDRSLVHIIEPRNPEPTAGFLKFRDNRASKHDFDGAGARYATAKAVRSLYGRRVGHHTGQGWQIGLRIATDRTLSVIILVTCSSGGRSGLNELRAGRPLGGLNNSIKRAREALRQPARRPDRRAAWEVHSCDLKYRRRPQTSRRREALLEKCCRVNRKKPARNAVSCRDAHPIVCTVRPYILYGIDEPGEQHLRLSDDMGARTDRIDDSPMPQRCCGGIKRRRILIEGVGGGWGY